MNFNPSIHITKSELIKLFNKYDFSIKHIDNFLADAALVSCNCRSVVTATNQRMLKAYHTRVDIETATAFEFNSYLVPILQNKFKGKYKAKITKGSVQFKVLKEVTVLALEFCNNFKLQTNIGFPKYIRLGLEVIGKNYRLTKFKYKHFDILSKYEDLQSIDKDVNNKVTKKLHKLYCKKVLSSQGKKVSYEGKEGYINFVYAAEELLAVGTTPAFWLESQFAELEFLNVIPSPGALHSTKARERFEKYAANNTEEEIDKKHKKFIKKLKKQRKIKQKEEKKSVQKVADKIAERIRKRQEQNS